MNVNEEIGLQSRPQWLDLDQSKMSGPDILPDFISRWRWLKSATRFFQWKTGRMFFSFSQLVSSFVLPCHWTSQWLFIKRRSITWRCSDEPLSANLDAFGIGRLRKVCRELARTLTAHRHWNVGLILFMLWGKINHATLGLIILNGPTFLVASFALLYPYHSRHVSKRFCAYQAALIL